MSPTTPPATDDAQGEGAAVGLPQTPEEYACPCICSHVGYDYWGVLLVDTDNGAVSCDANAEAEETINEETKSCFNDCSGDPIGSGADVDGSDGGDGDDADKDDGERDEGDIDGGGGDEGDGADEEGGEEEEEDEGEEGNEYPFPVCPCLCRRVGSR